MTSALVKAPFILCNILIMILGAASLGIGIWMSVDADHFMYFTRFFSPETVSSGLVKTAGYIMIAGGGATLVFGILGCVAACIESKCLLGIYILLIVVALAVEIAATVMGILFKEQWEQQLVTSLTSGMETSYGSTDNEKDRLFTDALNKYQMESHEKIIEPVIPVAKCCGIVNATAEYANAQNWLLVVGPGTVVPESCCIGENNTMCQIQPDSMNSYIDTSCKEKFEELLSMYHGVIIGITVGILAVELLLIGLAICLIAGKGKDYSMKHA